MNEAQHLASASGGRSVSAVPGTRRLKSALDVLASLAMLVASGIMIWFFLTVDRSQPTSREPAPPNRPVPLGSMSWGQASASVAIIQFTDFQCPFCRTFARETLPRLRSAYIDEGKVRFAIRHLPLESIHPFARRAAHASICAAEQGISAEYHDALFAPVARLADGDIFLFKTANSLKADAGVFEACMSTTNKQLGEDTALGADLLIEATPTFLVGGIIDGKSVAVERVVRGAVSFEQLSRVIESSLEKKR